MMTTCRCISGLYFSKSDCDIVAATRMASPNLDKLGFGTIQKRFFRASVAIHLYLTCLGLIIHKNVGAIYSQPPFAEMEEAPALLNWVNWGVFSVQVAWKFLIQRKFHAEY